MGGHHWFHDHWKFPHVNHPAADDLAKVDRLYEEWEAGKGPDPTTIGLSPEERQQFLALSPQLKEMFQRYHMDYHVRPSFYKKMPDHNIVGMHVDGGHLRAAVLRLRRSRRVLRPRTVRQVHRGDHPRAGPPHRWRPGQSHARGGAPAG